jgi:protein phosphatase 2C family protein 2/3
VAKNYYIPSQAAAIALHFGGGSNLATF